MEGQEKCRETDSSLFAFCVAENWFELGLDEINMDQKSLERNVAVFQSEIKLESHHAHHPCYVFQ